MLAKVDPYLRPLYDALYDMLEAERLSGYMERGTIEVAPLAFMRGRTLNDSFVVLDEAQNTTPEQMQMFLTRLGFGSKMVVTGDVTQVDLPREQASGLIQVREILAGIDDIGFVEFGNEDVVRHKLVQRIVRRTSGTPRRPARPAAGEATRSRSRRRIGAGRRSPRGTPPISHGALLASEGIAEGELGIAFVSSAEIRALKLEHLGIDEATDVPRSRSTPGTRSRMACPRSATSSSAPRWSARWRGPLVHGLLHLLGYEHGEEMGGASGEACGG